MVALAVMAVRIFLTIETLVLVASTAMADMAIGAPRYTMTISLALVTSKGIRYIYLYPDVTVSSFDFAWQRRAREGDKVSVSLYNTRIPLDSETLDVRYPLVRQLEHKVLFGKGLETPLPIPNNTLARIERMVGQHSTRTTCESLQLHQVLRLGSCSAVYKNIALTKTLDRNNFTSNAFDRFGCQKGILRKFLFFSCMNNEILVPVLYCNLTTISIRFKIS
jgi:hypothetical protein